MTTATALLPTSPLAVEDWLRSLANQSDLLKMREAGESEYPYLFGIATVKLADAHREYLRLLERQAAPPVRRDAHYEKHEVCPMSTIFTSRLHFAAVVRRAIREGTLVSYERDNWMGRTAVLRDGTVLTYELMAL